MEREAGESDNGDVVVMDKVHGDSCNRFGGLLTDPGGTLKSKQLALLVPSLHHTVRNQGDRFRWTVIGPNSKSGARISSTRVDAYGESHVSA